MKNLLLSVVGVLLITASLSGQNPISTPKAIFPEGAKRENVSVQVRILVDVNGKVISATALEGPQDRAFKQAAEEAAMKAVFSPKLINGAAVKFTKVMEYVFTIEPPSKYEEQFKTMALGMVLSVSKGFVSDIKKLSAEFESTDLFEEMGEDFPTLLKEIPNSAHLEKLAPAKRVEAIDRAGAAVRSSLSVSEQWKFDVGTSFGSIFRPIALMMAAGEEPDLSKLNETEMKAGLAKIKALLASAPADFPKEVLEKLRPMAAFADTKELFSEENAPRFGQAVLELLNTISPGLEK